MKKRALPTLSLICLTALDGLALAGCDATAPSSPSSPAAPLSTEAFQSALEQVLAESDPYLRAGKLAALLPGVAPESVPEIQGVLQKGMSRVDLAEFELLLRSWAAHDPVNAAAWALELQDPRFRPSAIAITIETWARLDPKAAVAGVTAVAQSANRETAQTVQHALVRGWFQVDRPAVERYIRSLGTSIEQQRGLLAYGLALWQAEGSEALMQWVEALPEDNNRFKQSAFRQATTALTWSDPQASELWCERHCDGPYGKGLRTTIARVRLNNGEDGAVLLDWISRAPEGQSKTHAMRSTFEGWAFRERADALQWMEQKITEGAPWVSTLYGAYARQLSVSSPARALEWAERIDAKKAREEMLVRISRRWRREDPVAAEAWLQQSSLPENARERSRNLALPDYLPDETPAS